MEDLDVIPRDEVLSVSVQLVTYNGNQKSAYGSVSVDFYFENGGEVSVKETISAYAVKSEPLLSGDRPQQVSMLLFVCMLFGMMWHDTCKWWRLRRSKAKRNRCHCVCGFTFFVLMVLTIMLWLVWGLVLTSSIAFDTEFRGAKEDTPSLSSVAHEVVALHNVAVFVSSYYFVFVLTTMVALYRWIFQILTFHKRMSIVADTLSRASTHLDHFLFVFFLVMMVFTNLTWLLVGSSSTQFSTAGEAWRSVIRVSLGEYENFYPQILAAQPTVGPVIVVLYQVLGVVLLLHVVIAVLLEAYRGVVGGMKDEDTILQSLIAFIGMTLCMWKARIQWADAYVRWRLSKRRPRLHQETRPSLKAALQGSAFVSGVDGLPVEMIRRPSASALAASERQLSFNCKRHITVIEMQALIEAAPVPAFVARRLVRKIVFEWVFRSQEKLSTEKATVSYSMGHGLSSGSIEASTESIPMLRQRDSF